MAITVVGTATANTVINGGNVTVVGATASVNDVIIVYGGHPNRAGTSVGPNDAAFVKVNASATNQQFGVWYKVITVVASQTNTITGLGTGNNADATGYGMVVLRGVHTTSPVDGTPVAVTGSSTNPDPPQITTITPNTLVFAAAGSVVTDTAVTAPAGYTQRGQKASGAETNPYTVSAGTLAKAASGTEDPASFTVWDTGSWSAITVAFRDASSIVGDSTPTLGTLTLSSTGQVLVKGDSSPTLGALTAVSAGQVLIQATATATLEALTLVSDGTPVAPGVNGTLDQTLGALTLSASGTIEIFGTFSQSLEALTLSADGHVSDRPVQGDLDVALDALTLSATGSVTVLGSLDVSLDPLVSDSAGAVLVKADASNALEALTALSDGTVADGPVATLNATLGDIVLSADGSVTGEGVIETPVRRDGGFAGPIGRARRKKKRPEEEDRSVREIQRLDEVIKAAMEPPTGSSEVEPPDDPRETSGHVVGATPINWEAKYRELQAQMAVMVEAKELEEEDDDEMKDIEAIVHALELA